jgi:hypothetical protein
MAKRSVLADIKQLRRAEQHVQWLRENLPKHSITLRVERELLLRRTDLALTHSDTVSAYIKAWMYVEAFIFIFSFCTDHSL